MKKYFVGIVALLFVFGIYILLATQRPPVNNLNKVVEKLAFIPSVTPIPTIKPQTKIILTGDIMLGRSVNMRSLDMGNPNYPFEKVAEKLKEGDIVFANLENPIIEDCPIIEHGFTFCADPRMATGLVFAGIDVVSIANNHTFNFGKKGFEDTKRILTNNSTLWVGDNNLEIIEKDSVKYGFLGFDFVTNTTPGKSVFDLIRDSKTKVDVLIVGVHWGNEYKSIANGHQIAWAKRIFDAGADIISGHHPHWVQNVECLDGRGIVTQLPYDFENCKPVFYSLGNFVFDQMWSEETRKGLAIELTFEEGKLIKEERYATYIANWAQPEWVN